VVIVGATPEGKKEFVGLADGVRESTLSWKEMLLDLRRRGLMIGPELAVADGALGFWKALEEVWPKTRGQRCWVHKTANLLNKLPKSQQAKAKRALEQIWMAETKKDAFAAFVGSDNIISIGREPYRRPVRNDKAPSCRTAEIDRLNGLRHSVDLVEFDQYGIGGLLGYSTTNENRICHENIVTHDLKVIA
jgi:hypothetical protein